MMNSTVQKHSPSSSRKVRGAEWPGSCGGTSVTDSVQIKPARALSLDRITRLAHVSKEYNKKIAY